MRYFLDGDEIVASSKPMNLPELEGLVADRLFAAQERDKTDSPVGLDMAAVRAAIVTPEKKQEAERESRRQMRNRLLAESDWTQLADRPEDALKKRWAAYRQKLRDLDLDGSKWPSAPKVSG